MRKMDINVVIVRPVYKNKCVNLHEKGVFTAVRPLSGALVKQVSLNKQTWSKSTSLPIETPSIVNDSNLITSDSFASSLSSLISESKVLTDIQHVDSSSSSEEDEAPPNKMVPGVTEDFV